MATTNTDTLTGKLGAIGDAIREKTESTELLTLDQMPPAIEGIQQAPFTPTTVLGDLGYWSANPFNTAAPYVGELGGVATEKIGIYSAAYYDKLCTGWRYVTAGYYPILSDNPDWSGIVHRGSSSNIQLAYLCMGESNNSTTYEFWIASRENYCLELERQNADEQPRYIRRQQLSPTRIQLLQEELGPYVATESGIKVLSGGETVDVDQATS